MGKMSICLSQNYQFQALALSDFSDFFQNEILQIKTTYYKNDKTAIAHKT